MTGYIVRRLISLLPVPLIVATMGFFPIYPTLGDPARAWTPMPQQEDADNLRRIMGLDPQLR